MRGLAVAKRNAGVDGPGLALVPTHDRATCPGVRGLPNSAGEPDLAGDLAPSRASNKRAERVGNFAHQTAFEI
jgi:hypothetical protein